LTDQPLRTYLSAAGPERAAHFSWERCARETLTVLERAAR
jgi:glycosyltransferase involved in cell wall biosynthesis